MHLSRKLWIVLTGVLLLPAAYVATHGGAQSDRTVPSDICSTGGTTPRTVGIAKIRRIAVAPGSIAVPGVHRFHQDESVDFRVTVPYNGTLTVHGYASEVPVRASQELSLPMRLEHTGRFPMHVHVASGQHIEVAVLEILPD